MQDWLIAHNIEFPERSLNRELLALIRRSNPQPKYVVDEMAKTFGHEVVCLPPYHCELNPIERCWSQVKGYIKKHNTKFTLAAVKELTYKGFSEVGPEQWKKTVQHVRNKVDHFWIADNLQEEYVEEFIIHVGGESDESTDEEQEELEEKSSNSECSISDSE